MHNFYALKQLSVILSLCFFFSPILSQVSQQWLKRYNGTGNFLDEAKFIAVDAAGNVYVAGWSVGTDQNYDFLTIKYGTTGNQLWVKRYNGPGDLSHNEDAIAALAVDKNGNVYVTGYSNSNDSQEDFATIKYDSTGNELWIKRYNGTGNGSDRPNALVIDQAGNVYVTGKTFQGAENSEDFVTIKYTTNGNVLWTKMYDGKKTGTDEAKAIAVDKAGNVYVTGYSTAEDPGQYSGMRYTTIKYSPKGKQLWVKGYAGVRGGSIASMIAVDNLGNVHVSGKTTAITGDEEVSDMATIKYNAKGKQLWVKRYNGPGDFYDGANSMALDSAGNVYVTGYSYGISTEQDYATIKYDASGNEIWVSRYNNPLRNGSDGATSLALDASGNVYVTGYSSVNETNDEYATIKYDTSGKQVWIKKYNGSGYLYNAADAIAVDSSGNVYVTGQSYAPTTSADFVTIKYVQALPLKVNAGDNKNIFLLPFGSACTVLTAKAQGGKKPYRYSWSGGGTSAQNIVCPVKSTTYTVTVTDANGTKATDKVKVTVTDVRCGSNGQKIRLCHDGTNICVTAWEAFWHYLHGDGLGECGAAISAVHNKGVGLQADNLLPVKELRISSAPNPFTESTRIHYDLPADGTVTLRVFDAMGRAVTTLAKGTQKAGTYIAHFNAANYPAGMYYYQITFQTKVHPAEVKSGKMILVR